MQHLSTVDKTIFDILTENSFESLRKANSNSDRKKADTTRDVIANTTAAPNSASNTSTPADGGARTETPPAGEPKKESEASPTPKAKPVIIDPLEDADAMVLDALNVGMLMMNRSKNAVIREALMDFVSKYGLLGFMTALPTTPRFLDYESAYLLKNHFIRDESMTVEDYTALFFPFDQPDMLFTESGVQWDISGDRDMMALAMTMSDKPMALNLCFQREYADSGR